MVVKTVSTGNRELADRPRLGIGPDDEAEKHQFEWRGLVTAWEAFGGGRHPGLGAVRPLAHVAEERTLIVCRVADPTLRSRLVSASRLRPGRTERNLPDAMFGLGRWLGAFHQLGRSQYPRRATRHERADVARTYARFLEHRHPRAAGLARSLAEAGTDLDSDLDLGLGHGDFAPRNAFVSASGEVKVIDILACWRVPIYEDIAFFLVELRMAGPELVLMGHAFPAPYRAQLETGFLDGYAAQSGIVLDPRALAWHIGLVVVDKWAAAVTRGPLPARQRLRHRLADRRLDEETRASAALRARVP